MMTLVRNQPLAEEITQNTFYRAMTSKKAFAQRSGELTWLCSIAKHLAVDEYRKTWKTTWSINANTYLLFLAAGILLGILCIAIGVTRGRK